MKVATVFSGIGSIEHALQTIGIPNEIVFACDNGDINPFDLKIKKDFISINEAFMCVNSKLKNVETILTSDNQATEIELQNNKLKEELGILEESLFKIQEKLFINLDTEKYLEEMSKKKLPPLLKSKFEHLTGINLVTIDLLEDYIKSFKEQKRESNDLKIITKMKKDKENVKVNKLMNRIISDLNMLNERIEVSLLFSKLQKEKSFNKKKEIVDNLYKATNKKNYVEKTYKENYDISDDNFHQDARFLDGNFYRNKVDLFVGGSPCQSFSLVGKRKGLEDTRGTLFYEYARLVSEIQPKVFIYENVKGLLSHNGGDTWKTIKQVFEDLGYHWHAKVLNARDFGIPQNRERIFVVGFRKDLKLDKPFEFPKEIPLKIKMQNLLSDTVSGKYYLNQKGVNFVTNEKNIQKRYTQINGEIQLCQKANQQFNWHGDFIFEEEKRPKEHVKEDLEKYFLSQKVEKYVMSSGTKNFYSNPEIDLKIARPLLTTMHKMHRAGVDNYVTTSGRIRKLTPRESLRLMGFCDSFKIVVSDTQMYRQAGNSIVVNVLIHLLNSICDSYIELINPNDKIPHYA